jgi:hypothetical protein
LADKLASRAVKESSHDVAIFADIIGRRLKAGYPMDALADYLSHVYASMAVEPVKGELLDTAREIKAAYEKAGEGG